MNVAEVFYKNNNFPHAIYAFEKYLQHYSGTTYAGRATELLELAKRNSPYPLNMPPLVFEGSTSRVTPETLQNIMKPAVEKSAITAGVDNSITSLYNRAHTLVNVGKHTDAMVIYKDLLNRTDFKFDSERKLVENSLFQLSVCLLKQNDLDSANSSFSTYIKNIHLENLSKNRYFISRKFRNCKEIAKGQGCYTVR